MKAHCFTSLISILLIILVVPGMSLGIVSAAEDTTPNDNGNSTVDLMIENLSFDPENPELGQKVEITASVKNQGTGESNSTNLAYYIDGNRIGNTEIPKIEAGQSKQVSFSWEPETEGTVEVTAKVDDEESVTETDENNNEKTKSLSIKNTGLPDLIIDTFKYTENLQPGDHEDIEISVKNQGESASEETKLKLYIGGNAVNEWDISSLSQGENSGPFSYTWIPTSEGSVEIKAVIDEGNLVNESDEENNQKVDTITVAQEFLPDLIVEDILPQQGDLQVGKSSNFTVKIKNKGTVSSAETVAKYYVNDIAANSNISIPPLSQGASVNVSFSLTPDKEGPMEVKVVVDYEETVYESDETNNQLIKEINVKALLPDLKIESISLNPESPKLGENIAFTITIKNDGPGDSPNNELKYIINGTNETYSGETPVSALSAGNSTNVIFFWTPGKEGQIEIKTIVDAAGVVPETKETNNELIKTAQITVTQESSSNDGSSGGSSHHSSSGGGGGGGGGSPEPQSNVEVKEISQAVVTNGKPIEFGFTKNATCVVYASFDAKKTAGKTTAIAEQLKGKSILVSQLNSAEVYKYFNLWIGNSGFATSKNIENPVVCFKVEKAWIKNNNVNQSLVTLQWYDKGWKPLYTEKVKEDQNYAYFKSKPSGFSFFAITEYSVVDSKDEKNISEASGQREVKETLKNLEGEVKTDIFNESAEKDGTNKDLMGKAKILMAISLPLFMILIEYFILRKKI